MRESATDLLVHLPEKSNITDILVGLHAKTPNHPLFSLKSDGGWKDITADDFLTSVSALA